MQYKAHSGFRVLCVEDDPNDVFFIKSTFDEVGHAQDLTVASSAEEAKEYLSKRGVGTRRILPDVVLLDLKMPGMGGFDFLKWLRAETGLSGLVVIVCSSSGIKQDVERAYELGANAFVMKPGSCEERLEFVKALYAFWSKWNLVLSN
jgi:CheY-like chemotaxis protein